jgi:hypothetical protein
MVSVQVHPHGVTGRAAETSAAGKKISAIRFASRASTDYLCHQIEDPLYPDTARRSLMHLPFARYTKACLAAGAIGAGALLALSAASASAQAPPDDHSMPGMEHDHGAPAAPPAAAPATAGAPTVSASSNGSSATVSVSANGTTNAPAAQPATAVAADPRYTG